MDHADKTVEADARTAERATAEQGAVPERSSRPMTQPATIRRLQSGLGNAAFARLMTSRRRPALHTHAPALSGNNATQTLFREESEEAAPAPLSPMRIQRDDSAGGVPPAPPAAPTPPSSSDSSGGPPAGNTETRTGIELIRKINAYSWVDPLDEIALENEWNKLGPEGARQYPEDYKKSINKGAEPQGKDLIIDQFKKAVIWLRDEYIDGNMKDVDKEKKRLGIDQDKPPEDQQAQLQELVNLAQKAQTLDKILKTYGEIQVGYGEEGEPDKADLDSPRATVLVEKPAYFIPGEPPKKPLRGGEKGARNYDEVLSNHASTMGALMAIANKHPSIYLALKNDQIDSLAGAEEQEPKDPLTAAKTMLADAQKAIQKTRDNKLAWDDLKPIHTQLLAGEKSSGGMNFGDVWNREIVKDEIDYEEDLKTAVDVGIGLAAACAFIFSEVATAGWATVFWAGVGLEIGAANVARKWGSYAELKTAVNAGTSQATELVSKGQVNSALLDAIIESGFFFIDSVGVAIKGVKGAQALGIKKAGMLAAEKTANLGALKTLESMTQQEAALAIKKSMDVVGVKRTAEAAGITVEELMAKAAGNEAVQAEIKTFMEASAKGVKSADLPAALRAVLKGEPVKGQSGIVLTVEDVFQQAVDEMGVPGMLHEVAKDGKGWKEVAAELGATSPAGRRMKAWRDAVRDDLKAYIETLRVPSDQDKALFKATGTEKDVTNDLDMSLLGPHSGELKEKAALFLAGRTGFSSDAKVLDKMVYIGLFTDPNRMHIFDGIKGLEGVQEKIAQRTMKLEEQLIWNDEYYKYLKQAGESPEAKRMAEEISQQMEALGVTKMPGYRQLSEKESSLLAKEQDALHQQIMKADPSEVPDLIEKLSNIQAQINIKEGGGYFSAGGVRKFVTDKEMFPGVRAAMTASHDLGAALDQVSKLRKSVVGFEEAVASGEAGEIARYIKDLAKYGDRFAQASEVLGEEALGKEGLERFNKMANDFRELIERARSGAVKKDLAVDAEKVIGEVRSATGQFDRNNLAVIQALRARAGIAGIGDLGPDVIKATQQRYLFLKTQAVLMSNMTSAIRAAGIPLQFVELDEKPADPSRAADDEPKGDFNPPPNNNTSAG